MELTSLVGRLSERGLVRRTEGIADDMRVGLLVSDSREAAPNSVFVAVRGAISDGHLFIDKAANNGAIAVVCEAVPGEVRSRPSGTAFIEVTDSRAALAEAASLQFGDPSRALRIVGVTGTNGKTTTSFLVHHLLNELGERAGLLGTILNDLGDAPVPATLTTPDPLFLQRALRTMLDRGCKACAMEVSSHALDQQRVGAVEFDAGVFTNLTPEHLDYHPTMDAYLAAKKRLFDGLPSGASAIYNADDPAGERMVADTLAQRISYGRRPGAAVRVRVEENGIGGLLLGLDDRIARFRLVGLFNAYNLAAAYGVGLALGYESEQVLEALQSAPPVPGRFQQLDGSGGRTVVIDYAHTPDALQNVLETASELRPPGVALWCVFGCGGDRDRTKRPVMGGIAERYADRVIVTSDNPRSEDPEAIMRDIEKGMDQPDRAMWIADRRRAIEAAAEASRPGDVVLIAGKGHETYQIVGTERLPFDDHEEAKRAFAG